MYGKFGRNRRYALYYCNSNLWVESPITRKGYMHDYCPVCGYSNCVCTRYRFGVTRDERGIESQTQEGIDAERHDDKWDAEGPEESEE